MMSQKSLFIDLDNCVGCHACEIACQQEHDLIFEARSKWCQVNTIKPRWLNQELHMDFVPVICFQCDDPICAYSCPVGAIFRSEDGIVVVDEEVCVGCKLCVYGCPYGAMFYNEVKGVAGKCDLCTSRIHHGLEPACVQHCIGGAIQFVTREELAVLTARRHVVSVGSISYASSKWKLTERS
jgi:Fe-S-cluster-containing dehydrogenase component